MNKQEIMEDFSKLKVAELRKELRTRGLTTTGNKTELLERLQEAIGSGGSVKIGSGSAAGAEDEDFDEEEILAGDDVDVTPQEEEAALGGSVKAGKKKGAPPSKISLKRSQPTAIAKPAAEGTKTDKKKTDKEDVNAKQQNKENSEDNSEPVKKVVKLDATEKAPLESRAERFGLPKSEAVLKESRAARFGDGANGTAKKVPKLSMETGGLDVDKLKARAERFGEVTSKSLSKLEAEGKMKQRSARFASNSIDSPKKVVVASTNAENAEKPVGNGVEKEKITAPAAKSAPGDDIKKKRAERFAV